METECVSPMSNFHVASGVSSSSPQACIDKRKKREGTGRWKEYKKGKKEEEKNGQKEEEKKRKEHIHR